MSGPYPAEPAFVVLHALRLKGLADEVSLGITTGLAPGTVRDATTVLETKGHAQLRTGRLTGWMLTPAGRTLHRQALGEELVAAGCAALVDGCYRQLLVRNEPFKTLCTSWQLRSTDPPVPNDHTDHDYDARLVDDLHFVHTAAMVIVGDLAGGLARFGPYGARFAHALAQVRAGIQDWFTTPLIGSYHDVWMELHEDLLLTLDIGRQEGVT